jgi:hypothetical protein
MASKGQLTGMTGVYLVAAQLSRHGFIASPTSRSARGADILVTDENCTRAFSVQVKTNNGNSSFWLLNEHVKEMVSPTHVYVLVNLREPKKPNEFYIVPSKIIAEKTFVQEKPTSTFWSVSREDMQEFANKWDFFKKDPE